MIVYVNVSPGLALATLADFEIVRRGAPTPICTGELVRVPTLVLAGSNDGSFLASTDYMAATIPKAVKVLIDGAGHAPNMEQPEAFNDALSSFLGGLTDL